MIVIQKTLTDEGIESRDYRDAISFEINGDKIFKVYDGEPEDNTLGSNFNDCYGIGEMLEKAYEAGRRGEDFEIILQRVDEL